MTKYTVSQVNSIIKTLFDNCNGLRSIQIVGEISNFTYYQRSGNMYFTLKDDTSQMKCVMFSSYSEKLKFTPEDGMKVVCFGRISVYEKDGAYQLYAFDIQPDGIGELTVAFEQLKQKLGSLGYFEESHKKPIPKYPTKIGVATSNMGAAVEDIKNILLRRYPLCEVIVVPTIVQGALAPNDIVKSIKFLDAFDGIDTIIVGRGGGSIEDLWAFNTQEVAQAVYECKTPIISAVGHETDFTICDFVADLRAPTPSAAAELAVVDKVSELLKINQLDINLQKGIDNYIDLKQLYLQNLLQSSPLSNIDNIFDNQHNLINDYMDIIKNKFANYLTNKNNEFAKLLYKLDTLNPLSTLQRGYAIATQNNIAINSAKIINKDENITITFKDGYANATINEVTINEK